MYWIWKSWTWMPAAPLLVTYTLAVVVPNGFEAGKVRVLLPQKTTEGLVLETEPVVAVSVELPVFLSVTVRCPISPSSR